MLMLQAGHALAGIPAFTVMQASGKPRTTNCRFVSVHAAFVCNYIHSWTWNTETQHSRRTLVSFRHVILPFSAWKQLLLLHLFMLFWGKLLHLCFSGAPDSNPNLRALKCPTCRRSPPDLLYLGQFGTGPTPPHPHPKKQLYVRTNKPGPHQNISKKAGGATTKFAL